MDAERPERHSHAEREERSVISAALIVPMLRVGMQPVTLCVTALDAQRPERRYHAERGNDPFKDVALLED